MNSPYARGAVTGVGVITAIAGLAELGSVILSKGRRNNPPDPPSPRGESVRRASADSAATSSPIAGGSACPSTISSRARRTPSAPAWTSSRCASAICRTGQLAALVRRDRRRRPPARRRASSSTIAPTSRSWRAPPACTCAETRRPRRAWPPSPGFGARRRRISHRPVGAFAGGGRRRRRRRRMRLSAVRHRISFRGEAGRASGRGTRRARAGVRALAAAGHRDRRHERGARGAVRARRRGRVSPPSALFMCLTPLPEVV